MNKIVLATIWLATAAICLAAGIFIANVNSPASDPEIVTVTKSVAAVTPRDDKDAETIASLRSRLKEAEDRIAELTAAQPTPANNNNATQQRWGRLSDEELARLKTEDPARYAEEMRRREEREAARAEWLEQRRQSEEKRDDFFANLNMDRMDSRDRETLESFIDDYQAFRDLMSNGGRDANGQPIDRREMMQFGRELASRAVDVRMAILKSYGANIGYNKAQSEQFASLINKMFEATSPLGPGGGRPRGGGGNNP